MKETFNLKDNRRQNLKSKITEAQNVFALVHLKNGNTYQMYDSSNTETMELIVQAMLAENNTYNLILSAVAIAQSIKENKPISRKSILIHQNLN